MKYLLITLDENDTETTPANEELFKKNNINMISNDKADIFHSFTVKCIFLCKIVRLEIQPAFEILCIIAGNKNEGFAKKLIRPLKYLN